MEIKKVILTEKQAETMYKKLVHDMNNDLHHMSVPDAQVKYLKEYPADMVYTVLLKYFSVTMTQIDAVLNVIHSNQFSGLHVRENHTNKSVNITISEIVDDNKFDA